MTDESYKLPEDLLNLKIRGDLADGSDLSFQMNEAQKKLMQNYVPGNKVSFVIKRFPPWWYYYLLDFIRSGHEQT